ncbi:MAG: response regulator [Candidatus Omnitrophota bacterium]|jgi:signal transduction histidine kinase/CheY-like chemotaxis protein|nr:MAG: response regulator [Candidatus Omnitrophota bacterium]
MIFNFCFVFCILQTVFTAHQSFASTEFIPLPPISDPSETWEYTSYLEDADLDNRMIFYIEFEKNGVVWIAASDGLHRYDGYRWKHYTKKDGLPSDHIRCLRFDREGNLWVGTDQGAGTFDGKTFTTHGSETGLAGPSIRRIIEDTDGSLWFCSDQWMDLTRQGGLSRYANGQWTAYRKENGFPSEYVTNYFRDSQGNQLILTGDVGLIQKVGEQWTHPLKKHGLHKDEHLWSIANLPSGGVIVTALVGCYLFENGEWRFDDPFPLQRPHQLCSTRDGRLMSFNVGFDTNGSYEMGLLEWVNNRFTPIPSLNYPDDNWVETVTEAPDGAIWCGGKNLLLRWSKGSKEWTVIKNFPLPRFIDSQERVWFWNQRAIIRLASGEWEQLEPIMGSFRQDNHGNIWRWNPSSLTHWSNDGEVQYETDEMNLKNLEEIIPDTLNNIWFFGNDEKGDAGIFLFSQGKWHAIEMVGFENQQIIHAAPDPNEGVWFLITTDQKEFHRLVKLSTTENTPKFIEISIPFLRQPRIHVDRNGTIWLRTPGFLFSFNPAVNQEWTRVDQTIGGIVLSMFDGANGNWFVCDTGSYGMSGFSRLWNGAWTHYQDRIERSIQCRNGETIFVGADTIYYFPVSHESPIFIAKPAKGYTSGIILDQEGDLWIRIGADVYRFRSDRIPPDTFLDYEQESIYQGNRLLCVCSAAEYHLPRSVPKNYRYSWRIDSDLWSPFSPQSMISLETHHLSPGIHRLEVRAQDEGSDIDPTPACWEFTILPMPLQERWWFQPALIAVSAIIILLTLISITLAYIAVKARNQAQRERKALQWISQKLAGPLNAREIAGSVAEESRRIFRHDAFFLDILNISKNQFIAIYNEDTPVNGSVPIEVAANTKELTSNLTESYQQVLAGESVLINRSQETSSPSLKTFGFSSRISRSLMFAPLIWENQTIGIISVQSYSPNRYQAKDLNLLKSFADHCNGALARVRAEEALKLKEEQLLHAQKMEAVGRLAGGVAHDFNNLLMAILGYGELALEKIGSDVLYRNYIEEMVKAGHRAASLTQQLLAFSRKQIIKPTVFNLNDAIRDMYKMLQRLIGEDIEIQMDLDPRLGCVKSDFGQIEQVLVNLSVNARDAMPDGGQLTIQTRNVDLREVDLNEKLDIPPGPYILLLVRDSGQGIEEEIQNNIFEPFFTTKGKEKGTGLGLSMVYGIIKQNNGVITVASAPGKGTTFSVYLPRVDQAPEIGEEKPSSLQSTQGNETILLAEDQDMVRQLVSRALQEKGYLVLDANSGAQAMQIQEQYKDAIHLLITDVIMPGMSGRELSNRMTSLRPDLKTIYISGYTENVISHHGVLEPGTLLLQKPFRMEILLQEVRRALDESV